MSELNLNDLVFCLSELEKLKTIERGLNVGQRKESSAEHSWSCMLLADILIDQVNEPLNRLKVLEFLLYHDLVEVYAGDAKFNDADALAKKSSKELAAFEKIQSFIPNKKRFSTIIHDYEARNCREAKFAKAIDCLDSCIRNLNDSSPRQKIGFTEALIRAKYKIPIAEFPLLEKLFENIMAQLKTAKKFG